MSEVEEDKELTKRERKQLNREKKRQEETKKEEQSGMMKKLGFVALVVVGALFFWNMLQGGGSKQDTTSNDAISNTTITSSDHVKGKADSQIVLVEYGDFQCSACVGYYPTIKEVAEKYADQISIVYRHFPLRTIHANAQMAAQASEAAAKQGKFWEMHDELFENYDDWSEAGDPRTNFISYAEKLSLNKEQFESDMNSDEVKKIVDQSFNQGVTLGINSTPTFILNGEKLNVAPTVEAFSKFIDEAIAQLPTESEESSDSAEIQE